MVILMNDSKRNIKIILGYDGTNYSGFQRQKNGITIQEKIESAGFQLTATNITITGAGRTDSGVHAKGQVVNFFTQTKLVPEKIQKALNAILPEDIVVQKVEEVPLDFHSRYSAKSKTYSYRIYNGESRPLFERNFVYFYKRQLNLTNMELAAKQICGTHDFKTFQATGSSVKTTIRKVNFCTLDQIGSEIRLEINADGFLYHMVRNIVGTLIMVGNGKITFEDFKKILDSQDRNLAGPTAPAQGLCLEKVYY